MADDGNRHSRDWLEIAEQASKETDPDKLLQFVDELCRRIDLLRAEKNRPQPISHKKVEPGPDRTDQTG